MLSLVVGLVLVIFLNLGWHAACFGQAPLGEVLLFRREGAHLGHVATWSHLLRSGYMQLQAVVLSTVASKTEREMGGISELRLGLRLVL